MVKSPFKDANKTKQFDGMVRLYNTKHRDLFLPEGVRRGPGRLGSSTASWFWKGYDGYPRGPEKNSGVYVLYRAGQLIAKQAIKDGRYLAECPKNIWCPTGIAAVDFPANQAPETDGEPNF